MKKFITIFCIIALIEISALIIGSIDKTININFTYIYIVFGIILGSLLLVLIYYCSLNFYIKIKFRSANKLIKSKKYNEAYEVINNTKSLSNSADQIYISQILSIFIDENKSAFMELLGKINKNKFLYLKTFWNTIYELSEENYDEAKKFYNQFNSIKVTFFYNKNYKMLQEILMALFEKNFPEEKRHLLTFKIKSQTIKNLLKK